MRRVIAIGSALASSLLLIGALAGCGGGKKASKPSKPPPVPTRLADGTTPPTMPAGLRRFRGRPVIRAKELPDFAAKLLCPPQRKVESQATLVGAWLSPDGLSVGYGVGNSQLYSCDAAPASGRLKKCAESLVEGDSLEKIARSESPATCSDPKPGRSFMWVGVPSQQTAFALVDNRSFWVGYATASKPLLRVTANEELDSADSFRARVVFLNNQGRPLQISH